MNIPTAQKVITFTYGDDPKEYSIPLARSLPLRFARQSAQIAAVKDEEQQGAMSIEFIISLLDRYCPELADEMTADEAGQLFNAWSEASQDDGVSVGESQALPD